MGNRLFHMFFVKSREKLMTDEGKKEIVAEEAMDVLGGGIE